MICFTTLKLKGTAAVSELCLEASRPQIAFPLLCGCSKLAVAPMLQKSHSSATNPLQRLQGPWEWRGEDVRVHINERKGSEMELSS